MTPSAASGVTRADGEDEQSADWCVSNDVFAICGTDMQEFSRKTEGVKWCFHCRKRHEFWWVVEVPVGMSYYGPSAYMAGVGNECSDLFPGWHREAAED